MKKYFISLSVLFVFACAEKRDYWDLDEFNMVGDALVEGEKFKVIYYLSIAPNDNPEKAYNHYIVVSEENGDTVNILSSGASAVEGPYEVYSYSGKYEDMIASMLDSLQESKEGTINYESVDDLVAENKKAQPENRKVLRDPRNDDIAKNNWPTVFGSLAKATRTNN